MASLITTAWGWLAGSGAATGTGAAAGGTAAGSAGLTAAGGTAGVVTGGGTAASAGGAAAAGGAAGGAAAGGLSASTLISGAATGFQALSALSQGERRAQRLESRSRRETIKAKQAEVEGLQQQNQITARLLDTLAAQEAAFAASGIDISSGTAESGREESREQASRRLSTARSNKRLNRLSRRARSRSLLLAAGNARAAGATEAIGDVASFGLNEANRAQRQDFRQRVLRGRS